jgi:hypothetical protein
VQGGEKDEDDSFVITIQGDEVKRSISWEKVSSKTLKVEDNIALTPLVNHTYWSYRHICNSI